MTESKKGKIVGILIIKTHTLYMLTGSESKCVVISET